MSPRAAAAGRGARSRAAIRRGGAARPVLAVAAAFGVFGCRASIPAAPAEALVRPAAPTAAGVSVCWIETAQSLGFTASALLVRHPGGDLLVDAGASGEFDADIADHPLFTRLRLRLVQGPLRPDPPLPAALRAAGEDPARIREVLVTHAHGDHLGGLADLPGVPGRLAPAELASVRAWGDEATFHQMPRLARRLLPRLTAVDFAPKPYEIFAESADLRGDGSLVLVPLPGHTPGSMGVFVNLPRGGRLFLVGDAAHDLAGIVEGREKPLLTRATDIDKGAADAMVARLHALWAADRTLTFLPGHDRAQWRAVFGGEPGRCIDTVAPPAAPGAASP